VVDYILWLCHECQVVSEFWISEILTIFDTLVVHDPICVL